MRKLVSFSHHDLYCLRRNRHIRLGTRANGYSHLAQLQDASCEVQGSMPHPTVFAKMDENHAFCGPFRVIGV